MTVSAQVAGTAISVQVPSRSPFTRGRPRLPVRGGFGPPGSRLSERLGAPNESGGIQRVSWISMRHEIPELYRLELEPEVRDWLDSLGDSDYKRVDEVCGMLA